MKILLPTNVPLDPVLPDGVEAVPYDTRAPLPEASRDAEAIVLWASSPTWMAQAARDLPNLRWIQSLSAGMDAIVEAGFGEDVVMCSGNGLHDVPVAEHALGLILAAARRLDVAVRAVDDHRWARELGVNQPLDNAGRFSLISGANVVIWGFGGIGQRLAGYLRPMGAKIVGVATRAGERGGYPVITPAELPGILPHTDVLVNILPATPATTAAVSASTFEAMADHAWLVNVGRGATVDQEALIAALHAGRIGGAALDVMTPEPLPSDSPLWDAPNLILTPHSAGGRPLGADDLIAANTRAFLEGRPLRNALG
nr:phosphoglycerate dehydrogenase [Serinibacter salmoneus]